jgi:hypothetical protein
MNRKDLAIVMIAAGIVATAVVSVPYALKAPDPPKTPVIVKSDQLTSPTIRIIPLTNPSRLHELQSSIVAQAAPPEPKPPEPPKPLVERPPSLDNAKLEPEPEPEQPPQRRWHGQDRQHYSRNGGSEFCARHGMHRVVINNGRSWRCRR